MGENTIFSLQEQIVSICANDAYSRNEILEQCGVSRSTLFRALNPLIQQGYIHCIPANTHTCGSHIVGRKSDSLRLVTNAVFAIGIDIRRDLAVAVIVNRNFAELLRIQTPIPEYKGWEETLKYLCKQLKQKSETLQLQSLAGVAVGLPIPVQLHKQTNQKSLTQEVKTIINEYWQTTVIVENTVRMDTAEERCWGATTGIKNHLYINISHGIGAVVVSNGDIIRGVNQLAGEIGHLTIRNSQTPCHCGKKGCLETIGSFNALLKATSSNNVAEFIEKYQNNNQEALESVEQAISAISTVLVSSSLLLNPEVIVLGGSMIETIPGITNKIEKSLLAEMIPDYIGKPNVVTARTRAQKMGYNAIATLVNDQDFIRKMTI